jgi:hypothetical protein
MILAWIVNAGALWFVVWAALSIVRQRRRRKAQHKARELVISPMAGLAFGAMALNFQAIYQPQIRHAIVEMQKEEDGDDESGGEPPGGRLFHQQLRRIRAGDEVEELAVRVDSAGADSKAT